MNEYQSTFQYFFVFFALSTSAALLVVFFDGRAINRTFRVPWGTSELPSGPGMEARGPADVPGVTTVVDATVVTETKLVEAAGATRRDATAFWETKTVSSAEEEPESRGRASAGVVATRAGDAMPRAGEGTTGATTGAAERGGEQG